MLENELISEKKRFCLVSITVDAIPFQKALTTWINLSNIKAHFHVLPMNVCLNNIKKVPIGSSQDKPMDSMTCETVIPSFGFNFPFLNVSV